MADRTASLTDRQRETLRALYRLGTVDAVAAELSLSRSAVEKSLAESRSRLGVGSSHVAADLFVTSEADCGSSAAGRSSVHIRRRLLNGGETEWAEGARVRLTRAQRFERILTYAGGIALVVVLLVIAARLLQALALPVRN